MFPPVRFSRIPAGWLAIPASLFLMTACTTPETPPPAEPVVHHTHAESTVAGSPFEQVFTGEADIIVLTFYDLYCVACQQSADNFTAAHGQLQSAFPGHTIQMTGVGIGDTAFELSVFQRRYALPYPSIPDPEKHFEEPFQIRGTPTILAYLRDNGNCIEIYRHEGRFRNSDLEKLLEIVRQTLSP
jgi:hypothetical protein